MESCEPPAALNALLWPVVTPKNRVGGYPVFSFVFAFQNIGAILATPDENGGCGYDFASGVHKYLYAEDNPVNGSDPSGHDFNLVSVLTAVSIGVSLEFASIDFQHGNYGMAALDTFGALTGGLGLFEDALPMALRLAPVAASAGTRTLTAAQSLKGLSVLIAATDLSRAMSAHHIMTNKNTKSTEPNGQRPFTPKFEKLLKGTGLTMDDQLNIVKVIDHSGPHPEANKYVYDSLLRALKGIPRSSPQYKQTIINTLRKLGNECATPGTKLNDLITKP